MSAEDEVRRASPQFCTALSAMASGNATALADIWSHGDTVTAMHPIGGRQVGWGPVRSSFEGVAQLALAGKVELADQHLFVADDAAFETGIERRRIKLGGHDVAIEHRVTNIDQRERGAWKVLHHHTDPAPAMLERVRSQAGTAKG